ncbi:cation diffusion facilitator family transporter [Spirochaeta lutea]|uniref:cation diffusion facilitator family transporter n=1 Tax=Spirochaeta lutea TaxID=1480694 RepID=UPI0009DD709A|nr:cation diffusion facilitator family transporter [Spirochaeta lutea]
MSKGKGIHEERRAAGLAAGGVSQVPPSKGGGAASGIAAGAEGAVPSRQDGAAAGIAAGAEDAVPSPHEGDRSASQEPDQNRSRRIYRVTLVGFMVNLLLSAGKLVAGILGHSGAMVADAVHSLSDVGTDVVVIGFIAISAKPRDRSHDYGHGKFETLASVIIGFVLGAVAAGILVQSVNLFRDWAAGVILPRPEWFALVAAGVSILVKEGLFRYTRAVGNQVKSAAVTANAWHHRSDALSSVGTLLGIGGAYFLGDPWRILDPIAAVVVSLLIGKAAVDLVLPGLRELLEASLPEETKREIIDLVRTHAKVHDPHNLKTRRLGNAIVVEFHIRVHPAMTVQESHGITVQLEAELRHRFGAATQVTIHVEPQKDCDLVQHDPLEPLPGEPAGQPEQKQN